jgi:hypothetical protein
MHNNVGPVPGPVNGSAAKGPWAIPSSDQVPVPPTKPPLVELPTNPKPIRKLDLARAVMPGVSGLRPVEQLVVRQMKGPGQMFTADLDSALNFLGLVHKPAGEFEERYEILADNLLKDPRLARLAKRVAFVPAFAWTTFEVVLMPVKVTSFSQRVVADLAKLKPRFPSYKAFIQWDDSKRRHVVYQEDLTAHEAELIHKVTWPTRDQILEALEVTAYDDLAALCEVNDEVRTLLSAREVA